MSRPYAEVKINDWDLLRPEVGGVEQVVVHRIDGWDETPGIRSDDQELVADDGEVASSERHYEARVLAVHGTVVSESFEALQRFRNRLAGVCSVGPERLMVVGHGDPAQWADVVSAGGLAGWERIAKGAARWQLQLKAPDPRKYGVTRRFPATGTSPARTAVSVSHEGNYPAAPRITVTGYMPEGFTAFGTGSDRFRVTEGVNTGEVLVADFKSGHVYLDGVRVPAAGGYRSLARIAPYISRATNVIPATEAGTGQYFVEVTDTWI